MVSSSISWFTDSLVFATCPLNPLPGEPCDICCPILVSCLLFGSTPITAPSSQPPVFHMQFWLLGIFASSSSQILMRLSYFLNSSRSLLNKVNDSVAVVPTFTPQKIVNDRTRNYKSPFSTTKIIILRKMNYLELKVYNTLPCRK